MRLTAPFVLFVLISPLVSACETVNSESFGAAHVVSMYALVACPRSYSGKKITTEGIVSVEAGEPPRLFLNAESRNYMMMTNSVVIKDQKILTSADDGTYMLLEGTFRPREGDEVSVLTGYLDDIVRKVPLKKLTSAHTSDYSN